MSNAITPFMNEVQKPQGNGFMSFDALRERFLTRSLYPKDGRATRVEGDRFADMLRIGSLAEIEQRINALLLDVRSAEHGLIKDEKMQAAVSIAANSKDSFELHYLTSMFIHHREVMIALAGNANIGEKTQMVIVNDETLRADSAVQRALAHNPQLREMPMIKLIRASDSPHVLLGVALNAAKRSKGASTANEYSEVCSALARGLGYDSVVRQAAIEGVRDPEVLRAIAESGSVVMVPRILEAVARNASTPDDVLQEMSSASFPRLQPYLSISVAELAYSTLESKRFEKQNSLSVQAPSP